jgi:hypothetical protein
VQQLGVERMSKSQVSRLAKSLDEIVEDFRTRPLEGAAYAYVTLDALVVKCREGGRTVNVCVVHAVGVNRDRFRGSLGLDVVTAEDGAAWLAFLRSLVARGLTGVRLVSSDAHPGLVDAIAATLPGASWQRCRTHFMRNLLTRVPKAAQSFVAGKAEQGGPPRWRRRRHLPRPALGDPPRRRRARRAERRVGRRLTPLHERRVDRESTHRPGRRPDRGGDGDRSRRVDVRRG